MKKSENFKSRVFWVFFFIIASGCVFPRTIFSSGNQENSYDRDFLQSLLSEQQKKAAQVDWGNHSEVVSYLNSSVRVSRNSDENKLISKVLFIPWDSIGEAMEAQICKDVIQILHLELVWVHSQFQDARIVLHISDPPLPLTRFLEKQKSETPQFEYIIIIWK